MSHWSNISAFKNKQNQGLSLKAKEKSKYVSSKNKSAQSFQILLSCEINA
jgi:hypothetical protein